MRDPMNRRGFGDTSNSKPLPYQRKLKVRESFYDHQFIDNHPSYPERVPVPMPWVNLKGYWLQEAGFTCGKALVVKVSKGKIELSIDSA